MARITNSRFLDFGDIFPALELTLTSGGRLRLPDELGQPYNVILVNRGVWCPYCVAQLKAFQSGLSRLTQAGIGVVSFSADARDKASEMVANLGLEFPIGYGAAVEQTAETLGLYFDPQPAHAPPHFHSAGFVLGPDHAVLNAVYSSGAIGRLTWQDVLGFVHYVRSASQVAETA